MNAQAHKFRAGLPDLADKLSGQMQALFDDPCADKCDRMLGSLHSAMGYVVQLRAELLTPEEPTV